MNIAIIDVGSNNIKLEIHSIDMRGRTELLYYDKIQARLGHSVFLSQKLDEENIKNAVEGLRHFANTIKKFQCKTTLAYGTAALREVNPEEFLRLVQKETSLQIKVITGIEEARMVYYGVLAHTPFNGRNFFLNDIGGGSTEVSIANEKDILFMESLRLGTVRLKELFTAEDNPPNYEMMENYIKKVIHPYLNDIKKYKIDMGLSTGGTAKNILDILAARFKLPEENGIPVIPTANLEKLAIEIKQMTPREIAKIKGLDITRADIIAHGVVLLHNIVRILDVDASLVSSRGFRDGALADFIYRKKNKHIYLERQKMFRTKGLEEIMHKYNVNEIHARQCAELGMKLFDLLKDTHNLSTANSEILYAASLLHDVGIFIDYSQHHKHSFYLIYNSVILGFSDKDKFIIALVARYHRKGLPKPSHLEYMSLSQEDKDIVLKLSAILRIADALDNSYSYAVKRVELLESTGNKITLGIAGKSDLTLELWSVERKKDYFEKVFQKKLSVQIL